MKWLKRFFDLIWPHRDRETDAERAQYEEEDKESYERIRDWQGLSNPDTELYLDAARRVLDEENQRKTSTEARATAFIAAIATLIPLMTWALGSSPPACERGMPCVAWATVFTVAVIFLLRAALWSLRTLSVANYHVIGVEDLVRMNKEANGKTARELIKKTLLVARKNRDTINGKLADIKIAQRCFVNGIFVLAVLLAIDPWLRFTLSTSKVAAPATSHSSCPLTSSRIAMSASSSTAMALHGTPAGAVQTASAAIRVASPAASASSKSNALAK